MSRSTASCGCTANTGPSELSESTRTRRAADTVYRLPCTPLTGRDGTIPTMTFPRASRGCVLDARRNKRPRARTRLSWRLRLPKNGTVRTVAAESAPTPEVKSRIEQQAQDWIFEPYSKDGVGVNVKLSTIV